MLLWLASRLSLYTRQAGHRNNNKVHTAPQACHRLQQAVHTWGAMWALLFFCALSTQHRRKSTNQMNNRRRGIPGPSHTWAAIIPTHCPVLSCPLVRDCHLISRYCLSVMLGFGAASRRASRVALEGLAPRDLGSSHVVFLPFPSFSLCLSLPLSPSFTHTERERDRSITSTPTALAIFSSSSRDSSTIQLNPTRLPSLLSSPLLFSSLFPITTTQLRNNLDLPTPLLSQLCSGSTTRFLFSHLSLYLRIL